MSGPVLIRVLPPRRRRMPLLPQLLVLLALASLSWVVAAGAVYAIRFVVARY